MSSIRPLTAETKLFLTALGMVVILVTSSPQTPEAASAYLSGRGYTGVRLKAPAPYHGRGAMRMESACRVNCRSEALLGSTRSRSTVRSRSDAPPSAPRAPRMAALHGSCWRRAGAAPTFRPGGHKEHAMNLRFLSRLLPRAVSEEEREHAYLSGATSMVDLELRQRELDRAKRRRPFPY